MVKPKKSTGLSVERPVVKRKSEDDLYRLKKTLKGSHVCSTDSQLYQESDTGGSVSKPKIRLLEGLYQLTVPDNDDDTSLVELGSSSQPKLRQSSTESDKNREETKNLQEKEEIEIDTIEVPNSEVDALGNLFAEIKLERQRKTEERKLAGKLVLRKTRQAKVKGDVESSGENRNDG